MDYKSIIIASPPRTGGMWTYNVVREIFTQLNKTIIPIDIPQDDNVMFNYHFKNLKSSDENISIIKIHKIIKREYANKTKILINLRDPRDAVISYKRFMKSQNFDLLEVTNFIQHFIDIISYYRKNHNKENLLELHYKDMIGNPEIIFPLLEDFLKIKIDNKMINKILEKFSKEKISKLIQEKEQLIKEKIKNKKKVDKKNLVTIDAKNVRIFDEKTGFQSGHVSNYKEGEWKKYFSNKEILSINKKFEKWLILNNFSL